MPTPRPSILLTGVTGLIGGELARRLARDPFGRVACLIRPMPDADPAERLADRLRRSDDDLPPGPGDRLEAVAGDVAAAGLGLSARDSARLVRNVHTIIHCAADTSFVHARRCFRINVAGMARLIGFARACRPGVRVVYLSTAANGGAVLDRCVREEDGCNPDAAHHNAYTRSKALAERMLIRSGLRHLVIRPSIVLSAGLPDPAFARSMLWLAPALMEFQALPIRADSQLDVVPVGHVIDAVMALLRRPDPRHACYHVSSGQVASQTCGEIGAFLCRFYGRSSPLRLLSPTAWSGRERQRCIRSPRQRTLFWAIRHYLPFLNMNVVYDNRRLHAEAPEVLGSLAPATGYLPSLLRLISPETAFAEAARP